MTGRALSLSFAFVFALPGLAAAAPSTAREHGTVETAHARWDHDLIVTDLVVRLNDGTQITVTEPGGTVDGIGMSVSHRDANLHRGDEVELMTEPSGLRVRRAAKHAVTVGVLAATGSRHGVQRTTKSLRPLYHPTGCLSFQYDARGSAKVEAEWAAFDAAFDAWESRTESSECGGLNFNHELVQDAPDGHDGVNTVHFRDTTWCRPASGLDPELCHSPDAVGVTRVLYVDDPVSPRDGEILEVDIEINAVNFALATDGRTTAIDLASAAAHEIGHALGLDHNCGTETGAWPVDDTGTLVPSCESASTDLVAATMYFQVPPGVTTMRTPEAGDVDGLCSVIQARCVGEISGGCSVSGTRNPTRAPFPLGALFAVFGFAFVLRRRRVALKR